jgi:heme/copper-type cytochrome/quinol oxidase subunit 1
LSMGAVSSVFAGFFYWVPIISSYTYDFFIADFIFFLFFFGVNITFFPMHFLGFSGMPRRIPDYPDSFICWNHLASVGSLISVISIIVFIFLNFNMLSLKIQTKRKYSWFLEF